MVCWRFISSVVRSSNKRQGSLNLFHTLTNSALMPDRLRRLPKMAYTVKQSRLLPLRELHLPLLTF